MYSDLSEIGIIAEIMKQHVESAVTGNDQQRQLIDE